jgi:hypothetical protein
MFGPIDTPETVRARAVTALVRLYSPEAADNVSAVIRYIEALESQAAEDEALLSKCVPHLERAVEREEFRASFG